MSYSPLARPHWRHVSATDLDSLSSGDWEALNTQRQAFQAAEQAEHVLRLLRVAKDDGSFGYPVNMFRHALQAATMVMRAGYDEETVVVTLLHDIGFTACPASHGEFAAALLQPYVSERNRWMLEHHAIFQEFHCHENGAVPDRHRREQWRGHPHFEWTAEWVARFDQNAQDPNYDSAPLSVFEPLVKRLFVG